LPFDLADDSSLAAWLAHHGPFDRILHAAAFTDVDGAETNRDLCHRSNVQATANLATWCGREGVPLVYISTDYVFAGNTTRQPLPPDWECTPRGVYALTKWQGETRVRELCPRNHVIVRISGLFGPGGRNFVKAIVNALRGPQPEVRVVDDQTCRVTYAPDLARALAQLDGAVGTYHAANAGALTWYEFALAIRDQLRSPKPMVPITSAELNRPAPRPVWSVFDTTSFDTAVGWPLPPWRDALARYMTAEGWL